MYPIEIRGVAVSCGYGRNREVNAVPFPGDLSVKDLG
jgi:hypothetical protein